MAANSAKKNGESTETNSSVLKGKNRIQTAAGWKRMVEKKRELEKKEKK
jgi:hypothetical protein